MLEFKTVQHESDIFEGCTWGVEPSFLVYRHLENYETRQEQMKYLEQVTTYGCVSGLVEDLICNADTTCYALYFMDDIYELLDNYGYTLAEVVKKEDNDLEGALTFCAWMLYEHCAGVILEEWREADEEDEEE